MCKGLGCDCVTHGQLRLELGVRVQVQARPEALDGTLLLLFLASQLAKHAAGLGCSARGAKDETLGAAHERGARWPSMRQKNALWAASIAATWSSQPRGIETCQPKGCLRSPIEEDATASAL